jgi:hypothetical protein
MARHECAAAASAPRRAPRRRSGSVTPAALLLLAAAAACAPRASAQGAPWKVGRATVRARRGRGGAPRRPAPPPRQTRPPRAPTEPGPGPPAPGRPLNPLSTSYTHPPTLHQFYGGPDSFTKFFDGARGEGSFGILEMVRRLGGRCGKLHGQGMCVFEAGAGTGAGPGSSSCN